MKKVILIAALIILGTPKVYADFQVIKASFFQQALYEYIAEKSRVNKEDIVVEFKTPLADETAPLGKLNVEIKIAPNAKLLGFTVAEISIFVDEKLVKKFIAEMRVDYKVKAYMSSRWIERMESLNDANLLLVDAYRSRLPVDYVIDEKELNGKVTKVALPKGRFITRSLLDVPAVIKTKSIVDVIVVSQHLKIDAKATALMDGRVGEIIRLRLLDSRKDIFGKVVDDNTVSVHIPN